ncbi:Uncharacterised protein [Sphingobacterium mizutaii]|uniref:Uncharacterized protein n=1 Tax=Sphingobacterium mizutaii TaxID=1010 RepID=A0AAJ5C258_9SPHI|nr:hypothetical protein SAMN05192578_105102 [Sphingobacterium mizutaii]SNV65609.1 Uncharacterised protein [Sphingobacterium mizutaii]
MFHGERGMGGLTKILKIKAGRDKFKILRKLTKAVVLQQARIPLLRILILNSQFRIGNEA